LIVAGGPDSSDEGFNNNNNNNNNNNPHAIFASKQVPQDGQKGSSKLQNIDAFLQEAAATPADCGSAMELPPWFDLDKFKRYN